MVGLDRLGTVLGEVDLEAERQQMLTRDLLVDRIVLGQQCVASVEGRRLFGAHNRSGGRGCNRCTGHYLADAVEQLLSPHGLGEVRAPAVLGLVALGTQSIECGQEDDRQLGGFRLRPNAIRHRVPVETRHHDIENYKVEAIPSGLRRGQLCKRVFARNCRADAPAPLVDIGADDLQGGLAVVDDQDVERPDRDRGRGYHPLRLGELDVEPEARALAERALERDLAAHFLDQLADDRQTKPGTAETPGGGVVGLMKGIEELALVVGGDPDPGVANFERKQTRLSGHASHGQGNLPFLGELGGVAHEVGQDLAQA